jgi:hypothetical protein
VLTLEDAGLRVSVLDPREDEARLGSRYVAGGYVWQVTDEQHGPLLAGPQFPARNPPVFDGQGLPEVFETALGAERAGVGDEVYVIGVGRVRRESTVRPFHVRDNPTVTERAVWTLTVTKTRVEAETHASFDGFVFGLARTLEVRGRKLTSTTRLRNTGARVVPVRWFAHPFFPWSNAVGGECLRLSLESALPDTAPLVENPTTRYLERRAGVDWSAGHYMTPRVTLGAKLRVDQRHPTLGTVRLQCRFPLGGLAIWGNGNTVSVEPFFQTLVEPGGEGRWGVEYAF